jgi:uncharacterized membrane protein (UPF0127 family)
MNFARRLLHGLAPGILLGSLVAGCKPADSPDVHAKSPPPLADKPLHLDHAQPKLLTVKLWAGPEILVTEVAATQTEIATGMMFRKEMKENEGMLFVFPRPYQIAFYMKNTSIPLSAGYIGSDGTLLEIHDLVPLDETPVPANSDQVQFVLEVNQGWFERHKIKVGTVVRTEFGSLQESFFRRR